MILRAGFLDGWRQPGVEKLRYRELYRVRLMQFGA